MSLNPEIQCDAKRVVNKGTLIFTCNYQKCGNLRIEEPISPNEVVRRAVTLREIYCQKDRQG